MGRRSLSPPHAEGPRVRRPCARPEAGPAAARLAMAAYVQKWADSIYLVQLRLPFF